LNPLAVLDRGYSIATDDAGTIVQDAEALTAGDTVSLRFARGSADTKVTRTRSD
jgi:exodeoxyribonuclease VII large subunit